MNPRTLSLQFLGAVVIVGAVVQTLATAASGLLEALGGVL